MQDIKLYTVDEVCEKLGLTRRTIYNYIKAQQLHAAKIGKYWYIAHDEFLRFSQEGTDAKYLDFIKKGGKDE